MEATTMLYQDLILEADRWQHFLVPNSNGFALEPKFGSLNMQLKANLM